MWLKFKTQLRDSVPECVSRQKLRKAIRVNKAAVSGNHSAQVEYETFYLFIYNFSYI